jgi:hypothetical protein
MADSKLKTVTKDEPCRHCGKPDWCYRLDDLEVCKRGMIADGWQATTASDTEGSLYLRIAKADRPWGQTFKHEYKYFDSDRTATVTRTYLADKSGKDCKMQSGTKQADLMPYKWELVSNADQIFLAEGELKADDLMDRGLLTTSCRLWTDKQASLFTGKTVVLILDCDREGIKKSGKASALLTKHGATVQYCYLPRIGNWQYLPENGGLDSYDYFRLGGTVDELRDCITDRPLEFKSDRPDEDDLSLDANHLAGLTNYPKPDSGLLPEVIERAIDGLAEKMGLSPELYYADLLSAAGSLIPIGATLLIDSGTDYHCPPIFWVGTVAETGAMKSPKSKAILNPLIELQHNAEEIYKAELEIWQAQEKSGESTDKKPVGRDYYLSDFTLEYISQTISKQPLQGFTLYMDELAAFFRGFDQYRNGKGSDRARFLSAYDGGAWKSNRKSDDTRVFAKRTGISIIGGIQPSVLQKIMTDDLSSEDGLWARFSWIRLPLTKTPAPSGGKYLVGDLLKGLYRDLSNLPAATYTLSKQAQQLWADWHDEMESIKLVEASPILRAIYPKMKERAGRIALIAHCINHRDGLSAEVSVETLQKAISFTRWLIAQSKELYAEFGIGDNPEMSRILKFVNRFQGCGELTSKQVRGWWSGTKKPKLQEIRDFMTKVVNLGYAIANGDPTKGDYKISITKLSHFSHLPLEPLQGQDLTGDYKLVTNLVTIVTSPNPENPKGDYSDYKSDYSLVINQTQTEQDIQPQVTKVTKVSKNGIENYEDFADF